MSLDIQVFRLPGIVVSFFRNRCLRSGANAGPRRNGVGTFLRPSFRHGWHRSCDAGRTHRLDEHRLVYRVCSFLPLIGLLTLFLPNLKEGQMVFNGFQSARLPAAQAPTAVRILLGLENVAGRS